MAIEPHPSEPSPPLPAQPAGGWVDGRELHEPDRRERRGLLGTLGFLALLGAKFGKIALIALKGGKFSATAISMVISIGAYTLLWGWHFALGFVLLLFVHELGHAIQAKREGLNVSAPIFVPFLGAAILMRSQPRSALVEARVAIAGPILGSLGALVVYWAALTYDSQLLQALAFTGFFLNLFNLVPLSPLDGGRIATALSPALWLVGLVAMVGLFFLYPNPILAFIVLLGIFESWGRWRGRKQAGDYYSSVTPAQRRAVAFAYLGLVVALALLMQVSHLPRTL